MTVTNVGRKVLFMQKIKERGAKMAHTHSVIDADKHFKIDPITRAIENQSEKLVLIQGDHNSERFTFELPLTVENHYMNLCNKVEVHYINVKADKTEQIEDIYEVDDLSFNDDTVAFSWLVSGNATKYAGKLSFVIKFKCVADDGTADYVWNTAIFSEISISDGINNAEALADEYSDILASWQARILAVEMAVKKGQSTNGYSGYNPFEAIELAQTEKGSSYYMDKGSGEIKPKELADTSPVVKCPKFLGIRIEDSKTRVYLYIGDYAKGVFTLDENYILDKTDAGTINYLNHNHNRFIETDGTKYFYYKIAVGDSSKVSLVGCDVFPKGESDIIATTPNFINNEGEKKIEYKDYYSVVLPNNSFYAVLHKNSLYDYNDFPFSVSYECTDGSIAITRGASFGYIPANAGAALLRLPNEYPLSDLTIFTSKPVKSNTNSGRRKVAKEAGIKAIKDFSFKSAKDIFWNDGQRPMSVGRTFYGVPYSSRWVNSHYVGFEVSPETALNALNDPCSIAYDGGYCFNEDRSDTEQYVVSGKSEIVNQFDDDGAFKAGGGTGYGLVCSAFTNLICGNPYPQSNRGYTFDSNFAVKNKVDMNAGEVLINKGLSHCVFVDEIYDEGYSLYEAVDPCVTKTVHTSPPEIPSYAASKVRTSYLDKYIFSVVNKDTSGYDNPIHLLNCDFTKIKPANGNVRPWRGHKSVYGSWDTMAKADDRDFGGSGIGVTIHNGIKKFTLYTPYNADGIEINVPDGNLYVDISSYVTTDGTYTLDAKDGTTPEQFRFYNHATVQLTFDAHGKAVFKYLDGTAADDVEYIYVKVKGFGGEIGKNSSYDQNSEGTIVVAAGNYYPDLAADVSRITDVRGAIVSDPTEFVEVITETNDNYSFVPSHTPVKKIYIQRVDAEIDSETGEKEYKDITPANYDGVKAISLTVKAGDIIRYATDCWGKYTCATSPIVISNYISNNENNGSSARIAEVSLTSNGWVGDASPYSQVVEIEGVTPYSQVDLTPSIDQLAVFYQKDLAFVTENDNGVVTVYALGDKPKNDYTIQVTITEVSV